MMEVKKDLGTKRTYLWIVVGLLLGIAFVMAAFTIIRPNTKLVAPGSSNTSTGKVTTNKEGVQVLPPAVDQNGQPVDQLKDVDPIKPFIDDMGVEHPPLQSAPAPAPAPAPINDVPPVEPAPTE